MLTFISHSAAEDNDPDSSMLSSPSNEGDHDSDQNLYNEDEDEDHELFPSSARPSTPKNNDLNAAAPGELSPPQSQPTSQRAGIGADDAVDMTSMNDAGAAAAAYNHVNGTDGAGQMSGQLNGAPYVPGMGWRTKRANEDYHRAAEMLADRDFSLREFGDLFDDRAAMQKQTSSGTSEAR